MDIKNLTIDKVQELYLDRINNFLTDAVFAEHHGMNIAEAQLLILYGARLHENYAQLYRKLRCLNNLK